MPRLLIILGSTRPGRVGLPIARWFEGVAAEHGAFEIDLADLAEVGLPMLDEPEHPSLGAYRHDHTKAWSARVDGADAVALVMPEYNHGYTAPIKNALDYLHAEWMHKAVGFVSYGGVSAGLRAVNMIQAPLLALHMVPAVAGVAIPSVEQVVAADGRVEATEQMRSAAVRMLDELERLESSLRSLRVEQSASHELLTGR